ncbi:hypothetical protein, partial [Methylorubrum zatmanii]|uniref:hypothetical protein n=1 Tax=Methylorubrum zatmanii TaxID=29429 RepID=UPI0017840D61
MPALLPALATPRPRAGVTLRAVQVPDLDRLGGRRLGGFGGPFAHLCLGGGFIGRNSRIGGVHRLDLAGRGGGLG